MTNTTFIADRITRTARIATEIRAMEARGDYGGCRRQTLLDFDDAAGVSRDGLFSYRTAPTGWTTDRETAIDSWAR